MARNGRSGNRGRGRNRGGGGYARPLSEPCNFVEFDVAVGNGNQDIHHEDIFAALTAIIPVASISKYRISSLALEPINTPTSVVRPTILMGISGNEYLISNTAKPTKLRLGKDYGDDGMWLVTDGAALTDAALPGNETTTDGFISVIVGVTTWSSTLHVRCAWQDPT